MSCGGHAMCVMIKAQIKYLALKALINSGKLSEDNFVAPREQLEEAEVEFLARQGPVDPQTEGMKADKDIETEIQLIVVEENLIRLKMMVEREARREEEREERRCAKEMEARREEDKREERGHAKEIEARRKEREKEMEAKQEEEAQEIARYASLMEEKEREEARKIAQYVWELELWHARTQSTAKTEMNPAKHEPVFNASEAQRIILRFTIKAPEEFFDHFETVAATIKWPEDKWSLLLQSVLFGKGRSSYLFLSQDQRMEYQEVKKSLLQVYQMTPEYYNERFQSLKKDEKMTYLDYAYEVLRCFKRYEEAANIKEKADLEELIILEQYLRVS
ncbi:uncharacterized protein [Palaemon carinicauda]|uniref:uncharacterized protein n=1 Tax=Palaemon carinicauda TaxID=392227 RepID=UPI0035B5E622